MTTPELYPLRFEPLFQYRLWGGRALGPFMGVELPGSEPIGEAWLLSDRNDHASRISNGALKGRTLTDLMGERKADLLGDQAGRFDRFPLLLKFLDVEEMLSVQVHPRDDQSDLIPQGDTGKTESWVVLSAKPESRIFAGLKPGVTPEDLRSLTTQNSAERLAGFRPEAGQAVLIEAGTVHALGDGLMVFELQENSDVTFRLYDWGHIDARTGKPRPLQVDDALASTDFTKGAVKPIEPSTAANGHGQPLFDDRHFALTRWTGSRPFEVGKAGQARVLVCIEGAVDIEAGAHVEAMERGTVVLTPACLGVSTVKPLSAATVLEIAIPEPT
jgi:mannose-6-phosphate isomerase